MVGIELKNVTRRFDDVLALDRVSLKIDAGEFFCLLGPSGCGKTTLLRILAGFDQPANGRVFFAERDVTAVPPHARDTGMVFQNYALWPHMTVWKNVEYGLTMRNMARHERDQKVKRALEMVQMSDYAERSPNQLSGGQQQRVALARALVIEPGVVLLDEPLSNLDARLRLELRDQLQDLQRALGVTMVYVTHDQKEALAMGDRIAVMQMGKVAQIDAPRAVYTQPATRFVADFIGEINLISGEVISIDPEVVVATDVGDIRGRAGYENAQVGDRALCAIRPEALDFLIGEPEATDNVIDGRVRRAIYLGGGEQFVVELANGDPIKLITYGATARGARPGDAVRLRFSQERVIALRDDEEARDEAI